MRKAERKELARLRNKDWRDRTEAEHRRLIILTKKAKPFNAMPAQEKKR